MKKPKIQFKCEYCGSKMILAGDEHEGVWWVHCLNKNCSGNGGNSIVMAPKSNIKAIGEHWLFEQFTEYDWRKKDALAWLNEIWKEYQQYCWENQ